MSSTHIEATEVLIVGAGQAGIAMSEHLTAQGVPHVVLERDRVAERWRTCRWDSLVANGPAWHDRFPNLEFDGVDPDAFAGKDRVASYFEEYVAKFDLPVRTGVEVISATPIEGQNGYLVETTEGTIQADFVVAATGAFQVPSYPNIIPETTGITQIHSNDYKNPEQLPEGNVLVIGGGSSGVQIADELQDAGRNVYLSLSAHDRPPRSYRNRDFVWWLGVLGKWEAATPPQGAEHVTIAVSGAHGGHTVDFRALANKGITLLGRSVAFEDGKLQFNSDLAKSIREGDENYLSILREADEYIAKHGLNLPEEPEAHIILDDPECISDPILELDLEAAGITSIVWATGFTCDYSWLKVDSFDERGNPLHQRGVSRVPGVYFLGLPWQSRRGSSFIWGVWHDAKYLADQIGIQRTYKFYRSPHDPVAAPVESEKELQTA